jgi:ATP-dependent protease ClpP protease subunit
MIKPSLRIAAACWMIASAWPVHGALKSPADFRAKVAKRMATGIQMTTAGSGYILLIGVIDTGTVAYVRKALEADPHIDTLLVDSYGGDIDSAMDIAAILHQRKMRLVVDGRCLSACAAFWFPAAASKTVLPGSVVAIHGQSAHYVDNGVAKLATESEALELFHSKGKASNLADFNRALARHGDFNRQAGVRGDADAAFARYLAHRKQVFGTDMITDRQHAEGCPPVQMWAMDQRQWEALGVKGIESFWYPVTVEQQAQVLRDLGMPADYFYYGPASGLERLCTEPPGLMARLRRWLGS